MSVPGIRTRRCPPGSHSRSRVPLRVAASYTPFGRKRPRGTPLRSSRSHPCTRAWSPPTKRMRSRQSSLERRSRHARFHHWPLPRPTDCYRSPLLRSTDRCPRERSRRQPQPQGRERSRRASSTSSERLASFGPQNSTYKTSDFGPAGQSLQAQSVPECVRITSTSSTPPPSPSASSPPPSAAPPPPPAHLPHHPSGPAR